MEKTIKIKKVSSTSCSDSYVVLVTDANQYLHVHKDSAKWAEELALKVLDKPVPTPLKKRKIVEKTIEYFVKESFLCTESMETLEFLIYPFTEGDNFTSGKTLVWEPKTPLEVTVEGELAVSFKEAKNRKEYEAIVASCFCGVCANIYTRKYLEAHPWK